MKPIARRKILFVDDERHWRDKVGASLAEAGFDVMSAADGSEAMERATDPALGLMIVDEDLAGESGLVLSNFLRCNHPGVPTVLFTTTTYPAANTMEMRREVADQWVPKGCVDELIVTASTYLA